MEIIVLAVLAPSVVMLAVAAGFGRAAASSDHHSDAAARALGLRQLARRRGDRRSADRRADTASVSAERRSGDRRADDRRRDPLGLGPAEAEKDPDSPLQLQLL